MVCRDIARSCLPVAAGPSTRRRLPSSVITRGPCRRQKMSATNWNAPRAHDSGRRQTSFQPSAYPTDASRSPTELTSRSSPAGP